MEYDVVVVIITATADAAFTVSQICTQDTINQLISPVIRWMIHRDCRTQEF